MKLYTLHISPSETDGEGEDFDEWFTSFEAAMRRRRELILASPYSSVGRDEHDYAIERVELLPLPPRELALRILNRRGFTKTRTEVVPPYIFPPDPNPSTSIFDGSPL